MIMKKYKLGEICTIVPGYAFKATDFGKGLNYVIKIKDIMPPYIDILHSEKVETVIDKKYEIKYGDFVMAMTGATIGKIGKLQIDSESKVYINQRVCKFIPEAFCDKEYLYYKLNTQEFQQFIYNNVDSKLAQPNIGHPTIYKYELELPLLSEQRRIGQFLKAIDDKIALNRSINHNLEAMAKQLYDYWFVQFDFPDENGKPYKSNGGEMIYSDALKKYIPKGWTHSPLRVLVDLEDFKRIPLSNAQRAERKGEFPYYGATGIVDYIDDFIFDYDILLLAEDGSTSDSNGFPVVQYVWGEVWVNNHAHIILPKDRAHLIYTYFLLKSIPVKMIETGSIQKKISQENLLRHKAINVPKQLRDIYTERIKPMWEQKKLATEEIIQLTKLRDSLLPLLMNGQVSVNYDLSNDWFLSSRKFLLYMV